MGSSMYCKVISFAVCLYREFKNNPPGQQLYLL